MTTTYFLAKRDGSGWWMLVDTLQVKHEDNIKPLQVAQAAWPQASAPDYKILLAVRRED